jgi:hypothetical protein
MAFLIDKRLFIRYVIVIQSVIVYILRIIEYTSKEEVAVCNLASICLPKFVDSDGKFNYEKLH